MSDELELTRAFGVPRLPDHVVQQIALLLSLEVCGHPADTACAERPKLRANQVFIARVVPT